MLDVVHGRDLWPVKADLSQFEQVIVNLAVNARDAMPDGGKLSLRTANVSAAECEISPSRACREPNMSGSMSPTPVPAFRPISSTGSSSRSSPPRRSTRAPVSASPRSTASSSRPADSSIRSRRSAAAPRSAFSCRATFPPRKRRCRSRPKAAAGDRQAGARRRHRPGHHPAGGGRGGVARPQCARAHLAGLHGAAGGQRHRGHRGDRRPFRQDRPRGVRRGHAGDGRTRRCSRNCAAAIPA